MQNIHYYRHKDTQTHSKGKQRYPLMYCSDETRDCWPSVGVYGLWGALIPKWIFLQGNLWDLLMQGSIFKDFYQDNFKCIDSDKYVTFRMLKLQQITLYKSAITVPTV